VGKHRLGDTKKTVIVIDDDKSILRTFTRILQKAGYYVDTAETGKEAIEKLTAQTYDVALIDIKLPDMDGPDLLMSKRENLANSVKILITGLSSGDYAPKTIQQGVDAFLIKPVKPEDLLSLIEEKLKDRNSEKNRPSEK
jgi:DNA-binding NtrC family response regulator